MTENRSQFDRRTMANDARRLSLLDRRCNISRRRKEKAKSDMRFMQVSFGVSVFGAAISYLLFISEVIK